MQGLVIPQVLSSFRPRYCAIVRRLAPLYTEYALKDNDATVSLRTLLSLPSSRRDPLPQDVRSRCRFDESRLILVVRLRSRDGNGDQNVPLSVASVLKTFHCFQNQSEDRHKSKCLIRQLSFMSIVYSRLFLRSI